MNYRRVPRFRRYPYIGPDLETAQTKTVDLESIENGSDKNAVLTIPMPNENENSAPVNPGQVRNHKPLSLDSFIKNIHADDIILLGLIFILIQEKLEDEFLIIVLIYLFVSGRNW